ncbi:MAG: peptidoglycan-associated lipoprotein Pal [Pseudomonadota bacterium]
MSISKLGWILVAALALTACSRGENADALFQGQTSLEDEFAAAGALGPDGQPLPPTSRAFFQQVIGDRVFFSVDQHQLTPEATAVLDQQANWLLANAAGTITIEGHADEQGTRDYNIALSNRRAAAVRDYLVTRGVPDGRLTLVPFGKERPVEVCSTEACYSKNRRAVTVVGSAIGS